MIKQSFIFLLFLSACGRVEYEADFIEHVKSFEKETNIVVEVPIVFDSDVEDKYVAVCYRYFYKNAIVKVNPRQWENLSFYGREETIYHELGHCILNREHDETLTNPNGMGYIPNSIMYPYIFGDDFYYSLYREHYVEELLYPGKRLR